MSDGLLPDTTSDEQDLGWGDEPADDAGDASRSTDTDEERLRAERPPHHDRP